MTITERLEQDKEKLIALLKEAGTPERAIPVLESETDRLLAAAAEELEGDRARLAASQMLQTARMAMRFTDSVGELRSWSRKAGSSQGERRERPVLPAALLIAGILLILAAFLASSLGGLNLFAAAITPVFLLLFALGGLCLFLSGLFFGRGKKARGAKQEETMTEKLVDAEKLYRCFRAVTIVIDQCLKECSSADLFDEQRMAAASAKGVSREEIELFASLLEASYSGDAELTWERMEGIRYYLHLHNIDVVDISPKTKEYFDLLPAPGLSTLRPALLSDGTVLKRGLASATAAALKSDGNA